MAADAEPDPSIVIRIVYDGPPEVGKTTSVRALARSFGRQVFTPEEQNGRTAYFDWMEHVGGRFDGAPIRCQVASVPGQRRWRPRRDRLLDQADVVIFVGDTSAAGWSGSRASLRRLLRRLARRDGPPVGVVFQANRRDVPDALPLARVRQEIGAEHVAVIESIAVDGTGVREAFVFAIRLALDRVREEQRRGLESGHTRAEIDVDDLLTDLMFLEQGDDDERVTDLMFLEQRDDEGPVTDGTTACAAVDDDAPLAPTHEVPSGLVWPPIDGRIVLRDASRPHARGHGDAAGNWVASLAGDWQAHSAADAVFTDREEGRERLVAWARAHTSALGLLSRQRCIALAETGDGRWRLWQVVLSHPSLREHLADADGAVDVVHRLGAIGRALAEAREASASSSLCPPCTLDTLGLSELGRAIYVGMAPPAGTRVADAADEAALARELAATILQRGGDLHAVRAGLLRAADVDFGPRSALRERLLFALDMHDHAGARPC